VKLRAAHWLLFAFGLAGAAASRAAGPPEESARCHAMGMRLRRPGDATALEAALPWLEKAAKLAPSNSDYLGDYGGTCLELADKKRSYFLAVKGRDLLEKTTQMNPDDLDARNGLMEFYARAPWPLGDSDKAAAEAQEIARRSPALAVSTELHLGRMLEKRGETPEALAAYREAARLDPGNSEAATAIARLQ
jgi:cytochrome c-type biogenesis protein CcmH/NrfG